LCQSCGLCCDGSLFGRVRLEPSEVDSARRHRLPVVQNGGSFEEPCTALVTQGAHHNCSIYVDRPESCRRFVCELYAGHLRDEGSLKDRIAVVHRAKALLAFLESAGLRTDDEGSNSRSEAWMPVVRELAQLLNIAFARAATPDENVPLIAATWVGKPKVCWTRATSKSRWSRHSRAAPRALGGAARDSTADGFGAHVERIERGVGRPLAPREPVGHGGNRRGSAKHARGTCAAVD
jgi:hypothetical protein